MQKLPKFGEKVRNFDVEKEEGALAMLREFLTREGARKKVSECEADNDWEMIKVNKDCNGLKHQYGAHHCSQYYLSPEEAFYLSTRKVINISPVSVLMNSQVITQKILLYSYLKRKGVEINVNRTTLAEAFQKYFGETRKFQKPDYTEDLGGERIKKADEILELCLGETYVYSDGVFEKIKISAWDPGAEINKT